MKSKVVHSRKSDEWSTPDDLFDRLDKEFHFYVDAAATSHNTKCFIFFGPGSQFPDALALAEWGLPYNPQAIWLNPPYSKCRQFIAKAAEEAKKGCTVVCLVPSRTDTRWWHDHIWDAEQNTWRPGVEVRFIKGRLKFGGSAHGAPFPSVIVIFRPCIAGPDGV